jgi:hypothetical protein
MEEPTYRSWLDRILTLQLGVAWAGEADTTPSRLGWWRTSMCEEYGGYDLLRRLAPRTWEWAALEACRAAAHKIDEVARGAADNPDDLLSLYHLGFETDERVDERLHELKQSGVAPGDALSELGDLVSEWSRERVESWLGGYPTTEYTGTATGRRLRGDVPSDPREVAERLAAALLPISDRYPLPHFRSRR